MNKEDYDRKIREAEYRFEKEKKEIRLQFAKANAKAKVGDIIRDHQGFMKVEKLVCYVGYDTYPQMMYSGILLDSKMKPTKKRKERHSFDFNITEVKDGQ